MGIVGKVITIVSGALFFFFLGGSGLGWALIFGLITLIFAFAWLAKDFSGYSERKKDFIEVIIIRWKL